MNRSSRRARLHEIADIASSLREAPIQAPDFTSAILDRVDVERPFLAPSVRRRLPWVRMGIGACALLGVLTVVLTHRWAPKAVQLAEQPAPLSDVVESCATCQKLISLRPVLSSPQTDPSTLLAAVVTAARLAQDESLAPTLPPEAPVTLTALLPLSQAVPLETPAASAPSTVHGTRGLAAFRPSLAASQSVLPESGVPGATMASDVPKVKVFPTFFEHDLDGIVLPR